jgi:hypothetical protein
MSKCTFGDFDPHGKERFLHRKVEILVRVVRRGHLLSTRSRWIESDNDGLVVSWNTREGNVRCLVCVRQINEVLPLRRSLFDVVARPWIVR